ncbi:MAG: 50S ribosomal protein L15e [Candidatus Woesearchaeota archaeon]
MGFMKYLKQTFRKELSKRDENYRKRMIDFRQEPATVRVERPTRLDRAKTLGYKAKQGVFVVRQRVKRGSHVRERNIKGRRSRNQGMRKNLTKNYQQIAEERVQKKYVNCEVLNSYFVSKDGQHYWYEVIMVDKDSPVVRKDKQFKFLLAPKNTKRVFRGTTSAGKKARGLDSKGKGAEKLRPSRKAAFNRKVNAQKKK